MNKFLTYLKGTLFAPKETFKTLIKDKKINFFVYIFIFIIFYVLYNFISKNIQRSDVQSSIFANLTNSYLNYFNLYSPLIVIVTSTLYAAIIHFLSHLFSKKGSIKIIFITFGFISLATGLPVLVIKALSNIFPLIRIISFLISAYSMYLNYLAVRSIYEISRKKTIAFIFISIIFVYLLSAYPIFLSLKNSNFIKEQKIASIELTKREEELARQLEFDIKIFKILKAESKSEVVQLKIIGDEGFNEKNNFKENKVAQGIQTEISKLRAKLTVEKLQKDPLMKGYLVFVSEETIGRKDPIGVIKANDQFDILRLKKTTGNEVELDTDTIINKLKDWDKKYSLTIIGADFDWVEAKINLMPENIKSFANEVYNFCPDVVDQGVETVEKLAKEIQETKTLYCWWD